MFGLAVVAHEDEWYISIKISLSSVRSKKSSYGCYCIMSMSMALDNVIYISSEVP